MARRKKPKARVGFGQSKHRAARVQRFEAKNAGTKVVKKAHEQRRNDGLVKET